MSQLSEEMAKQLEQIAVDEGVNLRVLTFCVAETEGLTFAKNERGKWTVTRTDASGQTSEAALVDFAKSDPLWSDYFPALYPTGAGARLEAAAANSANRYNHNLSGVSGKTPAVEALIGDRYAHNAPKKESR